MNRELYKEIFAEFLNELEELRDSKSEEYATKDNVLVNFEWASKRRNVPASDILNDWMDKHVNSLDMEMNGIVDLPLPKLKEKIYLFI